MKKLSDITYDLLHKYNVQGPRYTSYPPAPSWSNDFGSQNYESLIEKSNQTGRPLSLYLHLPFCEKLCYFCGCTTFITGKNRSFVNPYLQSIMKESEWLADRVDKNRRVIQFHLGGGTPTFHSPDELKALMDNIRKNFIFDDEAEVGLEVDPRVTTTDHLKMLKASGFNRISMGVQDFNPKVQQAVNRVQPYEATKNLVDESREMGFVSVNLDLIYGLPHQTPDSFDQTLDLIFKLDPDRLAVYSYAHVPWLKEHQQHFVDHLPNEKEKFGIFVTALKRFLTQGYQYIGMDHFAKPQDELALAQKGRTLWRNFMGYTTKVGTDLFGLGMSSIGHVHGDFVQNEKEVKKYQSLIQSGKPATIRGFYLNQDDKIRSRVIQNLLCHAVVLKEEINKEFEIQFDTYFKDALNRLSPLAEDGLIELNQDRVEPTELGRIFLRNIAMAFDAYLPKPGKKKVFSKTV